MRELLRMEGEIRVVGIMVLMVLGELIVKRGNEKGVERVGWRVMVVEVGLKIVGGRGEGFGGMYDGREMGCVVKRIVSGGRVVVLVE